MGIKRVIPCLDVKDGRVVKGTNFIDLKDAGDPVEFAKRYEAGGADGLVFLDITATTEGRRSVFDVVKKVTSAISMPLTVGGGIKTEEDLKDMKAAGAGRISLNTAAVKDPTLITKAVEVFGKDGVVLAVDVKKSGNGDWKVCINGGETITDLDLIEWVKQGVSLGASEILLTSMDGDGTTDGYDIGVTKKVANAVDVPVVASGGAGKLEDFYKVLAEGEADAVLAASVFHFDTFSIKEVKQYLKDKGMEVSL